MAAAAANRRPLFTTLFSTPLFTTATTTHTPGVPAGRTQHPQPRSTGEHSLLHNLIHHYLLLLLLLQTHGGTAVNGRPPITTLLLYTTIYYTHTTHTHTHTHTPAGTVGRTQWPQRRSTGDHSYRGSATHETGPHKHPIPPPPTRL
jgi:hypothetical protein